MPSAQFLATYDGSWSVDVPPTHIDAAPSTPQALRKAFFERTGLNAFVLHMDGLDLGLAREVYTVRLELAEPSTLAQTPHPSLPRARVWQKPGWFRETVAWLETAISKQIGKLEQVSTNDLSAVLRVETASHRAYLKTSEAGLETSMSTHIATNQSGLSSGVLAFDRDRNLLLTKDCGTKLSEVANLEPWQWAVRKLTNTQRTADAKIWQALGCPTHPFDDLAARATSFFHDGGALTHWGLSREQITALQKRLPDLVRAHTRIGKLELPLLPAHGDAHPMNALTGCGTVWFDWSEAAVQHPLFDIGWFLAWLSHPARASLPLLERHPDAVALLWHTYQETAKLSPKILLSDVLHLALTQRALVYHERYAHWQGTVPGWRPQFVPFVLRSLLKLPL